MLHGLAHAGLRALDERAAEKVDHLTDSSRSKYDKTLRQHVLLMQTLYPQSVHIKNAPRALEVAEGRDLEGRREDHGVLLRVLAQQLYT